MKFKQDFLANYLTVAPAALAIERVLECEILSSHEFPRPILDMGCGDGIFASILFDEPVDVGLDPNAKELERAGGTDAYARLLNCYGDKIPLPDQSFNTILSNSVLEHIENLEPVLVELRRLLTDEGSLYLTIPTEMFDQYNNVYQLCSLLGLSRVAKRYQSFFNRFWVHRHYHSIEEWARMFKRNGFVVSKYLEYGNKEMCLLNDALVPLAFDNFLIRKYLNRWFISPSLRKLTSYFYCPIIKMLMKVLKRESGRGGLVFFALRKDR